MVKEDKPFSKEARDLRRAEREMKHQEALHQEELQATYQSLRHSCRQYQDRNSLLEEVQVCSKSLFCFDSKHTRIGLTLKEEQRNERITFALHLAILFGALLFLPFNTLMLAIGGSIEYHKSNVTSIEIHQNNSETQKDLQENPPSVPFHATMTLVSLLTVGGGLTFLKRMQRKELNRVQKHFDDEFKYRLTNGILSIKNFKTEDVNSLQRLSSSDRLMQHRVKRAFAEGVELAAEKRRQIDMANEAARLTLEEEIRTQEKELQRLRDGADDHSHKVANVSGLSSLGVVGGLSFSDTEELVVQDVVRVWPTMTPKSPVQDSVVFR